MPQTQPENNSPFGMVMSDRAWTSTGGGYRFGFNGMEKDDEVKGEGNSLDFGARVYDSRLGRWLSLDPYRTIYSELSTYSYVANSPIWNKDPDGKRIKPASDYSLTSINSTLLVVFKNQNVLNTFINVDMNRTITDYNGSNARTNPNYGNIDGDGNDLSFGKFKRKLRKEGRRNGVRFKRAEAKLAYSYYTAAESEETTEVLITSARGIADETQYELSTDGDITDTQIKMESDDFIRVHGQLMRDEENARIRDAAGNDVLDGNGNPTYNTAQATAAKQSTLDNETGGNGQGFRVYGSGDILIDSGTTSDSNDSQQSVETNLLNQAIQQ